MNYYKVYDAGKGLLNSDQVVTGKTAIDAARKYVSQNYPNKKVVRYGKNVSLMLEKFIVIDGLRYKKGRTVWFEITSM